jgi:hypothetical protein
VDGLSFGSLTAVPLTRAEAVAFLERHHRHHTPAQGGKFRFGCAREGRLVGVIQVGRPGNRVLDNGGILEVTRLCTDGTANACSFLYARAAKIAWLMGYRRIITYILDSEDGASLRAAGWRKEADVAGRSWNCAGRERHTAAPTCDKQRWGKGLNAP